MNNLEKLQKAKDILSNKDDELCKALCIVLQHMIDADNSQIDATIDNVMINIVNYAIDISNNNDDILSLVIDK